MVYRIKGFGHINEQRESNFLSSDEVDEPRASAKEVADLLD